MGMSEGNIIILGRKKAKNHVLKHRRKLANMK